MHGATPNKKKVLESLLTVGLSNNSKGGGSKSTNRSSSTGSRGFNNTINRDSDKIISRGSDKPISRGSDKIIIKGFTRQSEDLTRQLVKELTSSFVVVLTGQSVGNMI